jgi:hypothetical protein
MVDNKSSLALAKNPVFHERSKHITSSEAAWKMEASEPASSTLQISLLTF